MKLSRTSRQGFTWVERLVLIVLIVVLVVLIKPAFNYAREKAHRMACMHNLKSIGCVCAVFFRQHQSPTVWHKLSNLECCSHVELLGIAHHSCVSQ